MTPEIYRSWSARSFTPIQTSEGIFDEIVCNIAYHFKEHGYKYYENIAQFTHAGVEHFRQFHNVGLVLSDGILDLPKGLYERDGRIISFMPERKRKKDPHQPSSG
jgi:hypothetical protein